MRNLVLRATLAGLAIVLACHVGWGAAISLDSVIGASGTRAGVGLSGTYTGTGGGTYTTAAQGAGNPVNLTGFGSNTGATTLSTDAASTFNFNTGFADTKDRAIGSTVNHNATFADRKSVGADEDGGYLVFDKNNNGNFGDETDEATGDANTWGLGFGMHADAFITFDLAQIRTNNSLASNTAFTLSGGTGYANFHPRTFGADYGFNSTAIVLDGVVLGVYDFNDNVTGITNPGGTSFSNGTPGTGYNAYQTFSNLAIPTTGHYLTFIGLSGLVSTNPGATQHNSGAHMGFSDVQITTVPAPEPSSFLTAAMLAAGGYATMSRHLRGRRT